MRYLLLSVFIFLAGQVYGQTFSYPEIKGRIKGQKLADFVPAGWIMLDSATGDLDKDGLDDAAIILQYKDSTVIINNDEDTTVTKPRILLVLLKNSISRELAVLEQSNSFILMDNNPARDDPYQELKIAGGILHIEFHLFYNMGSWYVTNAAYKFRYQKAQLVLIGADYFSFHRATHDFEEYSYNFLTRKRVLTKGNDNTGAKKTSWISLTAGPLKTLATFTEPFTWEVEKDVFL